MQAQPSIAQNLLNIVDEMTGDRTFAAQLVADGDVRLNDFIAKDGDLPVFVGDEVKIAPVFDGVSLAEMESPAVIDSREVVR